MIVMILMVKANMNVFSVCLFGSAGLVSYKVSVKGAVTAALKVTLIDKQGHCVASSNGPFGVLKVQDVNLWWPYLTHENPGYLYSMEVRLQICMEMSLVIWKYF